MLDEVRAVLARHLPGSRAGAVVPLGEGTDNVAYEVDGELIVRVAREVDPDAVRREAALLAEVARWSTLPVPEVIFVDPDAGVLGYAKVPGVALMRHPVPDPAALAPVLGAFLNSLHLAPVAIMAQLVAPDADPPAGWLREADGDHREIAGLIPAPSRRLVAAFLQAEAPAEAQDLVFCHNDLGAEHLLVDAVAGTLTGVIDWTDAAIADPARDVALLYRDLGPDVAGRALAHYDHPFDDAAWERAVFYARCKLLEDVAYGVRSGDRRYTDAGLAHLDRTFG